MKKNELEKKKGHSRKRIELPEEEVIREYHKIRSAKKVAKNFNVSVTPILRILHKNSVKMYGFTGISGKEHHNYGKKFSEELKKKMRENKTIKLPIEILIKKYMEEEKSCKEIAIEFNVSSTTIGKRLKKNGIKLRKSPTKERIKEISKATTDFYKKHPEVAIEQARKRRIKINSSIECMNKIKEARAKQIFPVKDSLIEIKIQNFLKQLGIEFMTHQYIKDIEHGYQCDILIPSMNLVIECDGNYWHKYPIGREIDHIRTSELLQKGFKVLRLWEFEIKAMDLNKFKERLI